MTQTLVLANIQQSRSIVDKDGRPLPDFVRTINDNNYNTKEIINQLLALPEIQAALANLDAATQAAQDAADNANQVAAQVTAETALANSSIDNPAPITVTDAGTNVTITIAAHNRIYGDGVTVPVNGGVITGQPYDTGQYIGYLDPDRTGGAVTYFSSTDPLAVRQSGDTHSVGYAPPISAADPPTPGGGVRPPGGSFFEP